MAVIRSVAEARRAPLRVAGEGGARWVPCDERWDLVTTRGTIPAVAPALKGAHQRTNAAVMATVADALTEQGIVGVSLEAIRTGIEDVAWPGRFEVVGGDPAIVLDGAHNVESAQRLREALADEYPGRRKVFVLGVAADKDVGGIVAELSRPEPAEGKHAAPAAPIVIATRAQHPRAADAAVIARSAEAAGARAEVATTVADALDAATRAAGRERTDELRTAPSAALDRARPDELVPELAGASSGARGGAAASAIIVVTGSLYTVAEAREALGLAQRDAEVAFDPWATR
jgi:dihydrofolate synthase/folylpolyglutamate synthase